MKVALDNRSEKSYSINNGFYGYHITKFGDIVFN